MDALATATECRLAVAQFKREVAALGRSQGARLVVDLFRNDNPGPLASIKVGEAIAAIYRVGAKMAEGYIADACPFQTMLPVKRLKDLTWAQREQLAARLEQL